MKKKAVKKLALSKETVRGLTDDLWRVRGGESGDSNVLATCSVSNCTYVCDAQETAAIWTCIN
jgi:hypothetical protein